MLRNLRYYLLTLAASTGLFAQTGPPSDVLSRAIDLFQAGEGRWAYLQTTTEFSRKGVLKSVETVKVDPSQPWDDREVLVTRDGQVATEKQQKSFQRDREKKRLKRERRSGSGGEKLRDRLDLNSARLLESTETTLRYHVSLEARPDDDFPAEKLETFIMVDRATEELRRVELRLRESFRKAGVVKLKSFELTVDFKTDPASTHPATIHYLEASAVASIVFIPVGGSAQVEFEGHRWVKPYDDRFEVQMGEATSIGF
jgi:hypothetical protein